MFELLSTWFAYPALLGVLAVLPVLALLLLRSRRRRMQACALLGQAGALQKLQQASQAPRVWLTVSLFLGLALLTVGAAGPRWGRMPNAANQRPARAVVLVLDVSRSMLAEQPSRQELARRALRNLGATLTAEGGPRLALVIFAAHAQLAFPLTGDYDHLLEALRRIDADDPPPSLRPRSGDGSVSGTRIGEALRLALHALDPKTGGDIILFSDGDDPAGDEEWLTGAEEARRHHIPVHVIGIGNPREAVTIPWGSGVLEFAGLPVLTRMKEKPLQEIARRTGGKYVPYQNGILPLGKLLPSILSPAAPAAGPADPEDGLPIRQPRYAWFLAPAFLFLALTLLASERRGHVHVPPSALATRLGFSPLLMALLSAAALPEVDTLVRQGNDALERGQNSKALRLFEEAEERAPDPALVAYNKAAALYRLERFEEAALHYQRCLEDETIPAGRRSRALFQMGNACLQESKGVSRSHLEKALDAYRSCLGMKETTGDVRTDARHNLELARLLWLKTIPDPNDPPRKDDLLSPRDKSMNPHVKKEDRNNGTGDAKGDEAASGEMPDFGKNDAPNNSKKAASGPLTVLPDRSELVPLSPQETEAHLESASQRILREGRQHRHHAVLAPENVKDW
jgi:Ca-activated chloride channel family protein